MIIRYRSKFLYKYRGYEEYRVMWLKIPFIKYHAKLTKVALDTFVSVLKAVFLYLMHLLKTNLYLENRKNARTCVQCKIIW